jgi:hypothetical protein
MPKQIARRIAAEAVQFAASTQVVGAVFFHAGWIILMLATWGHASGGEGMIAMVTRALTRAFVWLGGVDAAGHGDMNTIMLVWVKLSFGLYLIDLALRRWLGERRPLALGRIALLSGAIAAVGYTVAMWNEFAIRDGIWVIVLFSVLAAITTAWAVLVRRMASLLATAIDPPAAPERAVSY